MAKKPETTAERLARVSPTAGSEGDDGKEDVRPGPVRMTVVLGPGEYDRLQGFTHEIQENTGRRGVAASEVIRLAVARVLRDPVLRDELRDTIKVDGGNRRRDSGKRTRS